MHVSPAKEFIYIVSLSFSKIDNNYDKHLKFFQEWEIDEVKVCYVYYFTYTIQKCYKFLSCFLFVFFPFITSCLRCMYLRTLIANRRNKTYVNMK